MRIKDKQGLKMYTTFCQVSLLFTLSKKHRAFQLQYHFSQVVKAEVFGLQQNQAD